MSQKTAIEWTDATWSPLRARVKADAAEIAKSKGYTSLVAIAEKMAGHVGPHCEHVSPGCANCYAETNNHRCLPANGTGLPYDRRSRDLVDPLVDEKILKQPLGWRKAQRVFVENQSDLFGEWVADEAIDRVFAVMALCPQHSFQVLTKRPERMRRWSQGINVRRRGYWCEHGGYLQDVAIRTGLVKEDQLDELVASATRHWHPNLPERPESLGDASVYHVPWPLRNVHLGVSIEDQKTADERIPLLLQTPSAVRFVSYEPALGPVSFRWAKWAKHKPHPFVNNEYDGLRMIDWVIAGGESGPNARPAHPDWFREVRNQCLVAGVAYFFKQWGEWQNGSCENPAKDRIVLNDGRRFHLIEDTPDSETLNHWPDYEPCMMARVGKKAAGRLLDGRTWDEFPEARA